MSREEAATVLLAFGTFCFALGDIPLEERAPKIAAWFERCTPEQSVLLISALAPLAKAKGMI